MMYENRGAYGLVYDPEPVYEVIRTRWMSFDDILYLKGIESVLEIFYNSRQFEKSIAFLEHFLIHRLNCTARWQIFMKTGR